MSVIKKQQPKFKHISIMTTEERIKKMVSGNPVMLFMKGEPQAPQCGFSDRVIRILDHLGVQYSFFDVLSDEEIRQGIKVYGNWPTIPQLYIQGELFGGCDIIEEGFSSGALEKELQKAQETN